MEHSEDFNAFIPIEFEKAKINKTDGAAEERLIIKGVASTMDVDSDGEILDPNGFDLSHFMSKGHINWNHQVKNDPMAIIGEPLEAKIVNNQMVVKALLYKDNELAKKVYKIGQVLEKSGSSRRLGFSIEGKVTERDTVNKKYIKKAKITHLAVAPTPKNASTVMDISKGQMGGALEYDEVDGIILQEQHDGTTVIIKADMSIEVQMDGAALFREAVVTIHKAYANGEIDAENWDVIKSHLNGLSIDSESLVSKPIM